MSNRYLSRKSTAAGAARGFETFGTALRKRVGSRVFYVRRTMDSGKTWTAGELGGKTDRFPTLAVALQYADDLAGNSDDNMREEFARLYWLSRTHNPETALEQGRKQFDDWLAQHDERVRQEGYEAGLANAALDAQYASPE